MVESSCSGTPDSFAAFSALLQIDIRHPGSVFFAAALEIPQMTFSYG
jgi:hypothetical protein